MGVIEDNAAGSAASLWVIGIENLGITGLPGLINATILLSGMSCGKGHLYSSSRTLYGLARDGQAPRSLVKCTESGVPVYFVALVSLITCITFLVTAILYFGCKVWRVTETVDSQTADLVSGKAEVDEECKI
ncbi:General amino acid permease AGP2 [Metarhizium brunneum]|uniref:General amino acid permease AGP2 n=1 Tax=Metarhizium brunneum TaxID=500148 RepID=A0A7D5UT36_9HYPO